MNRKPDSVVQGPWIRRAKAAELRAQHGGASAQSQSRAGSPEQGWDPYEVWLRRIDLPRRRRDSGLR